MRHSILLAGKPEEAVLGYRSIPIQGPLLASDFLSLSCVSSYIYRYFGLMFVKQMHEGECCKYIAKFFSLEELWREGVDQASSCRLETCQFQFQTILFQAPCPGNAVR